MGDEASLSKGDCGGVNDFGIYRSQIVCCLETGLVTLVECISIAYSVAAQKCTMTCPGDQTTVVRELAKQQQ